MQYRTAMFYLYLRAEIRRLAGQTDDSQFLALAAGLLGNGHVLALVLQGVQSPSGVSVRFCTLRICMVISI